MSHGRLRALVSSLEATRSIINEFVTALAERGEPVGLCSLAILPTVQDGVVGRVSLLLVDGGHRRRGIATILVEQALAALHTAGCTRVEAMSDMEIANAHSLFRTLQFGQTSYRFARDIGPAQ